MNVKIIKWDLHEEISGFYKYDRRNRYIVINMNLEEYYQRFVCAHELGHVVLHPNVNALFLKKHTLFPLGKYEREANQFALSLLTCNEKFLACETKAEYCARNHIPQEMADYID